MHVLHRQPVSFTTFQTAIRSLWNAYIMGKVFGRKYLQKYHEKIYTSKVEQP